MVDSIQTTYLVKVVLERKTVEFDEDDSIKEIGDKIVAEYVLSSFCTNDVSFDLDRAEKLYQKVQKMDKTRE